MGIAVVLCNYLIFVDKCRFSCEPLSFSTRVPFRGNWLILLGISERILQKNLNVNNT